MRQIIILTILLTTISCKTDSSTKQGHFLADTIEIKNWLTKVVVDYRNNEQTVDSDKQLRSVLTEDYYNYKSTDITLEYDTLTKDQFTEHWKTKFQTQYIGDKGFFNWTQDSGPIKVIKCNIMKQLTDTSLICHLVIEDLRWNTKNQMDITVISKNKSLIIADVKHLD